MEPLLTINKNAAELISAETAFEYNILPVDINNNILKIGAGDSADRKMIKELEFDTGCQIEILTLPLSLIHKKLPECYPDFINNSHILDDQEISDASNIEFVDRIISGALNTGASDIHFEAMDEKYRVRYRIDGHLREVASLPINRHAQISSRLKIMADLDISEKRRPQDGRIAYSYENRNIDIRVSTIPASFGEKIVLRLLDKGRLCLDLAKLGLNSGQLKTFEEKINLPFGMILVTGPTGSGKTTSLYAALNSIDSSEKNILTIEDPVEYNLDGINQCQVKHDIGFNFVTALRSFLRQDPDIIMVGEIRDEETADIAVRSALTGHLVFSTLHTNDSVTAITRLTDMGIPPYLVASSVKLIIAQRLVRKLCKCSIGNNGKEREPRGCIECGYTGFRGRTALFEMMEIDPEIAELISNNASVGTIKKKLSEKNFKSLRESGIEKAEIGITTLNEVLRETAV